MPPCPPLFCPARICPLRVHCPSSNASFLTIRLALLTLKPSAGSTGSSADGAAKPANPTASPTGSRFYGGGLAAGGSRIRTIGPSEGIRRPRGFVRADFSDGGVSAEATSAALEDRDRRRP